jgi:hypothetical protein
MGGHEVNSCGSGLGQVVGCCEHDNEPSIKCGKFMELH